MHTCAAYEGNVYDALLIICCTAYMSNTCSTTYKLHISFLHIWHAKAYMPKMCTAYKFIIHISFLYNFEAEQNPAWPTPRCGKL